MRQLAQRAIVLMLLAAGQLGCAQILDVYDFGLGCADSTLALEDRCVDVGVSYKLPSCSDDAIVYPSLAACEPLDDQCPADPDPLTYAGSYDGASFVWDGAPDGGDGSAAAPFKTIAQAIQSASGSAHIVLAPGTYEEPVTIENWPINLEGVCARDVTIQTEDGQTGIEVISKEGKRGATMDSRVAHLSILSGGAGIRATSTSGLRIESVRIDSVHNAIFLQQRPPPGATPTPLDTATVQRALLSTTAGSAIVALGYELRISKTRIRQTGAALDEAGDLGAGIWMRPVPFSQLVNDLDLADFGGSYLEVSDSLIERTHYAGVLAEGTLVQLSKSVVRHVSAVGADVGWDDMGAGVSIGWQPWRSTVLPEHEPRSSLLEVLIHDVINVGVRARGVDLDVSKSTIRSVEPAPGSCVAHGVRAIGSPSGPANVDISQSHIHNVHEAAVHALGASLTIRESILEDVSACGTSADVVAVHDQPARRRPTPPDWGEPPQASVISSRLGGAARAALIGFGEVELCTQALSLTGVADELVAGRDLAVYDEVIPTADANIGTCSPDASLRVLDVNPGLLARDDEGEALPTLQADGIFEKDEARDGMEIWLQGRDAIPTAIATGDPPATWVHPWIPQQRPARLSFADPASQRALGLIAPVITATANFTESVRRLPTADFLLKGAWSGLGQRPANLGLGLLSLFPFDLKKSPVGGVTVSVDPPAGTVLYVREEEGDVGMFPTGPTSSNEGTVAIVELPPGLVTIKVEHPTLTCRAVTYAGSVLGTAAPNKLTLHVLPMPLTHVYFLCTKS